MEKKRYKVSVFDQDFHFVSDEQESVVLSAISEIENSVKLASKDVNLSKVHNLLLHLIQVSVQARQLQGRLNAYVDREIQLVSLVDSVSN